MPLEQTVTIVNNSGKIISTGKQLFSIFKEARGAYHDKKAELQSDRSMKRAQTFGPARSVAYRPEDYASQYEYEPVQYEDYHYGGRRHSYDVQSEASSHRSRSSRHTSTRRRREARPALTASNLEALSEVSSTAPSRAPPPAAYRSPYAETLPMDVALSKPDLTHADMRAMARRLPPEVAGLVPRRHSEADAGAGGKEIDMNLAYGNIPPDLADRVDLDPVASGSGADEARAQQLINKVEGLLDEAHCLQHSATAIIKHLQEKPDAAAEVALTLADLSKTVAKMSPALLGLLKGGSPAVFALLASPQFLIGTTIAVGVTVVMFGGWKIIKRVQERAQLLAAAREAPALEAAATQDGAHGPGGGRYYYDVGAGHHSAGVMDEALVVDEELSTIETWRRGITPFGGHDGESADLELITPEAAREKYAADDLDLRSYRSGRTHRTAKTHRSSKHAKDAGQGASSSKPDKKKEHGGSRSKGNPRAGDAVSVAGSDARSKKSSSSKSKDKRPSSAAKSVKAIDDGRSTSGGSKKGDQASLVFRSRARQGDNMLKAIFRDKKEKEATGSKRSLVMA